MSQGGSEPRLRTLAAPCLAVFLGLHLLHSAWIAALLYHVVILSQLRRGRDWKHPLLGGWRPALGIPMSLLCAAAGGVLYLLWPYISLEAPELGQTLASLGLQGLGLWGFCLYFTIVGTILEELFWRSGGAGGWLRDAAFAAYHALVLFLFLKPVWVAVVSVVLFVMAWAWNIIARRTGGLAIPVLSHGVGDLSVILALYFLLRS